MSTAAWAPEKSADGEEQPADSPFSSGRTLAFSIAALSLLSSSADAFLAPARFGSAPSVVLGQMQRRGVSASPARLARGVLLGVRGAACAQGWDKASYEKGLKSLSEEDEYAYDLDPSSVEGVVPLDVAGTLYTGGPGLFEFGKNKLESQKDGDGFVSAWTFAGDGSCKMRGRFVRTEGFLKVRFALSIVACLIWTDLCSAEYHPGHHQPLFLMQSVALSLIQSLALSLMQCLARPP